MVQSLEHISNDSNGQFEQILLDAIDQALSCLGESEKRSVYSSMEQKFNITRQEIPNRINDFADALESNFGLGAQLLEISFMKNLHAKLNVTCKWPTYEWPLSKWIVTEMTFPKYVHLMQQNFEAANDDKVEIGVLVRENEALQKI